MFETKDKVGGDLSAELDSFLQLLRRSLSALAGDRCIGSRVIRKALENFGAMGIDFGFGRLCRVSRTFRLRVLLLSGRRRVSVIGAVANENRGS